MDGPAPGAGHSYSPSVVEVVLLVVAALLIVLGALQLVVRWRSPDTAQVSGSRGAAFGTGLASGFTTMTANAAGPIMTRYLVAQGVEKRRFLGTSSLFFFGVNLCRISVSAGLGLFTASTVQRTAPLIPFVLLGAWAGLHGARKPSQKRFDQAVLAATIVSAVVLVVR